MGCGKGEADEAGNRLTQYQFAGQSYYVAFLTIVVSSIDPIKESAQRTGNAKRRQKVDS